ncbi:hypothetical protein KKG71_00210 [Patescibacteria group bacterium]|nr:hypothetical protein [Patescibacteria group bacterium]
MDFETPNKPKSPEAEKYSSVDKPELQQKPEAEVRIDYPERQEVVDRAIFELKTAFQTLGIKNYQLPQVKIKFIESENQGNPERGRVGHVHEDGSVEIYYDLRFSHKDSAETLENEIQKTSSYPGFQQTLKHELAHVAMWSVTGLQRQPATRLIDEGFASLVEHTDTELPLEETKHNVKQGLVEEKEHYERCLDFLKPINGETENLNEAEYIVGRALLMWIRELKGNEKMIELIQKSPEKSRRNDDSKIPDTGGKTPGVHTLNDEYSTIIANINNQPFVDVVKKATVWEGKQFEVALLEVTGFKNLEEVRREFLKWINQ